MADLIFSRKAQNTELSLFEVSQKAPAAFAERPIEGVSDRYGHYNTFDAIIQLKERGWLPVQAVQTKARKLDRINNTKHLVAFSHRDDIGKTEGEGRKELIIYNSSDRTCSLQLFAGYFRFICSNGCIAGEGSSFKVYHSKKKITGFDELLDQTIDNMHHSEFQRLSMMDKTISRLDAYQLSREALALRWNSLYEQMKATQPGNNIKPGSYWTDETAKAMLKPRRISENELIDGERYSVWDIFNRCQEGLMRGGMFVHSVSSRNPHGAIRSAKGIANVKEAVRINRSLWDQFEAIAA